MLSCLVNQEVEHTLSLPFITVTSLVLYISLVLFVFPFAYMVNALKSQAGLILRQRDIPFKSCFDHNVMSSPSPGYLIALNPWQHGSHQQRHFVFVCQPNPGSSIVRSVCISRFSGLLLHSFQCM